MSRRPPSMTLEQAARGLLGLAQTASKLKSTLRTGWLDRGISPRETESVADHSLGVALLAWASALEARDRGANIDPERVLKLAIVHDLAEAETGDIPPYAHEDVPVIENPDAREAFLNLRHVRDPERNSAKRAAEQAAMQRLLATLPAAPRREIEEIWNELRAGTSRESRFVKQVDRLETFLQSRSYQATTPDLPVDSFRKEVSELVDDPLLAAIRDAAMTPDDCPKG